MDDINGSIMDPAQIVRLKTGEREFAVHKTVLTARSEYFDKCLNGDFAEACAMVVTLDDVDPENLDVYLRACYVESFVQPAHFRIEPMGMRPCYSIAELVDLWKLCDRFMHASLAGAVEMAIKRTITAMGRGLRSFGDGARGTNLFADGFLILHANPEIGRSDNGDKMDLSAYLVNMFCKYCTIYKWEENVAELPVEFVTAVSIRWCRENGERRDGTWGSGQRLEIMEVE